MGAPNGLPGRSALGRAPARLRRAAGAGRSRRAAGRSRRRGSGVSRRNEESGLAFDDELGHCRRHSRRRPGGRRPSPRGSRAAGPRSGWTGRTGRRPRGARRHRPARRRGSTADPRPSRRTSLSTAGRSGPSPTTTALPGLPQRSERANERQRILGRLQPADRHEPVGLRATLDGRVRAGARRRFGSRPSSPRRTSPASRPARLSFSATQIGRRSPAAAEAARPTDRGRGRSLVRQERPAVDRVDADRDAREPGCQRVRAPPPWHC